jgi:hypothetical protein
MMVLSLDDVVSIPQSNMLFCSSIMEFFVFSLRKVGGGGGGGWCEIETF